MAAIKRAQHTTMNIALRMLVTVIFTGFFFFDFLFNGNSLKIGNTSKPKPNAV